MGKWQWKTNWDKITGSKILCIIIIVRCMSILKWPFFEQVQKLVPLLSSDV
ncbi:hypothetical protein HMPREF0083_00765 [Aneurinibacillus aneurinilyticus ATCC 12856]|uniref:Uncharacterized protein n=1 Tax=Aneurinibacillus aneurinilyticus ATCC 12856 TaxID=649747 RepID=U1WR88_ANEAE|nr:hypothetical protein HMPREF0083_00765 [Aneurinibacillus aneurinilyticus ATCC 12856]